MIICFTTFKTTLFNLTSMITNNNSLSHRTAMIWPMLLHRTAMNDKVLARADKLPNTNSAKLLTIQSGTPGRHPVSIHQMAPPKRGSIHPITALLFIYLLRKDERLSWLSQLTCIGRFTHISGHPLAAIQAQDRESSPAKDRRSTTVLRNQPVLCSRVVPWNVRGPSVWNVLPATPRWWIIKRAKAGVC